MFSVVCGILFTGTPDLMMHWDRYEGGNAAGQEPPKVEQTRRTAQEKGTRPHPGQGWLGIPLPLLTKVKFGDPPPPDRWNRSVRLVILIMGAVLFFVNSFSFEIIHFNKGMCLFMIVHRKEKLRII